MVITKMKYRKNEQSVKAVAYKKDDPMKYQGILHSYDGEKMYLLMLKTDQTHSSMHSEVESSESRQFFPFFGPFGLFGFPFFGIRRFGPFFPFFI
jgi:hypothetical protein